MYIVAVKQCWISTCCLECEQSPGVYLRDDPLQLQNYSELRAPSADKAAFYLDSALSSRGTHTHFLYTLHVYQYSVATKGAGEYFSVIYEILERVQEYRCSIVFRDFFLFFFFRKNDVVIM